MTRLFVLCFLLSFPGLAQLATTSDGSIFDFSSCVALKQEPLALNGCRVYRHGSQPFVRTSESPGIEISAPYLSADGKLAGIFGSIDGRRAVRLDLNGTVETFEGNWIAISRNGRFVATVDQSAARLTIRDRQTGASHEYPSAQIIFAFGTIADQGDLVFIDQSKLWHIPFGKPRSLLLEDVSVAQAVITPQGNRAIVYTFNNPGKLNFVTNYTLTEIDLASGGMTVLYEGTQRFVAFTTSADGQRLLVQRPDELLLWDRTSGWRSLLAHDEGFSSSVLADNGAVAFTLTNQNRFLRIETNSGSVEELYAPFPFFASQVSGGALPGSILRLSMFQNRPGLSLSIDNRYLPIIKSEPGIFDAQIPWEATDLVGRQLIAEITAPDSPFALRRLVNFASTIEPWAFTSREPLAVRRLEETHLVAANEDFSKLINPFNPTDPGSLVHFWLTGLGPLDHPVPTAQPAPASPIARPLARLTCTISNFEQRFPLEVLDVIYAPNLVGVYQVDVRIPAGWTSTRADIRCASGSSPTTGGLIAVLVR